MSFLQPNTSVDLNDPKYAHYTAQSWLVQNTAGEYVCQDRPEDGILCFTGCQIPKLHEIEQQPCKENKMVDLCGCGGCGSSAGAEDSVSVEEQAAMTATAIANSDECVAKLTTALADKAA